MILDAVAAFLVRATARFALTVMNNLRLALRLFAKSPGFVVLVVLTLAIGIGANTTIFSLVTATCLRPLPYPDPTRIVYVSERSGDGGDMSVSYPNFMDWRAAQDVFSALALFRSEGMKLKTDNGAEQVTMIQVSQDFFAVLGLHAAMGRDLRPEDDRVAAAPVIWLTHQTWQRYYHGAPDLVGRTIMLDGEATTVAGILPANFRFFHQAEGFVPLERSVDRLFMRERSNHNGTAAVARLKPGVSVEAARAQLAAIGQRLEHQFPNSDAGISVYVSSLRERLQGNGTTNLYLLLGAVAMVLLIACVNVANMLLARSFGRAREMAIRTALGATRADLFRQLLTESLLLAVGGGVVGAVLGTWGFDFVARLAPWEMRELIGSSGGFDHWVWLFVTLVTLGTGVVFGLAPAWQLSHANPNDALKNTRPVVRTLFGRFHLSDVLVLVQVALAVTLLVGAGLLIRGLERLTSVAPGFRPERVLTLRVATPPSVAMTRDPGAFIRHHESVIEKLQTLGEIESAAFASSLPYTWDNSSNWIFRPDRPPPEPGKYPIANNHIVTLDYFKTMGIPLVRGALFDGHEPRPTIPAGPVTMASIPKIYAGFVGSAVISQKMADQFWPGEDPVGKTFVIGEPRMQMVVMKIIGVVGNTTQFGAENGEQVEYYCLLSQWPATLSLHLVVRTRGDPARVVPQLRAAIRSIVPDEPIFDVKLMSERITNFSSDRRFSMALFTFFAATALLLATVGIYGVLACVVGQRTRDIGIRMALGAQRADVLRNVIMRGLALAMPGVVLGLIVAWAGSRLLQSQLFGVTSTDLPAYLLSGCVLLLAALAACALPAQRASKVNPVDALRSE